MRIVRSIMALALSLGILSTSLLAQDKVELKVGDKAPAFQAKDENGKLWKSSDVVGKKTLVVFFYPAATTGGCTKEACGYRDALEKFKGKDVEVVGVSGDSPEGQMVFKKKEKLNYTLLADEKGDIAKALGVPVGKGGVVKTKDADGKDVELTRGVTTQRWTFVIGKDGKIVEKETKVAAADDAKHILEVVEKLK